MNNFLCIYHGNCLDGFAAAWVIRKACGNHNVEFHAGVYQTSPPDVTCKDVVMVDFSYKRPVILEMAAKARSILIIDHYKTAFEDLQGLPENVRVVFDVEHSGCMLTWRYCFEEEPPRLLYHIEDRDLWRFKLPGTREINAALFSCPYDFALWDAWMGRDAIAQQNAIKDLEADGKAIERKHHKDIAELLGVMTRRMVISGYDVPIVNLPYTLSSDAGHKLAQGEPFAACYYDKPDGREFSLRSCDGGVDVSDIAKQYGGGGHEHAAGFRVPFQHELVLRMVGFSFVSGSVDSVLLDGDGRVVSVQVGEDYVRKAHKSEVYESYRKPGPTEVIAEG